MACSCGCLSPFLFASYPRPSIFSRDASYTKGAATGMTASQISSQAADTQLATYGRGMALGWIAKPGPVADPRKLAVAHKGRKA